MTEALRHPHPHPEPDYPVIHGFNHMSPERFKEFLLQEKEIYSQPGTVHSPHEYLSKGYTQINEKGKVYYYKAYKKDDEAILLDDNGRIIEHWRNWDTVGKSVTTTTYDEDGYVTETAFMKLSGFGNKGEILYKTDSDGNFELSGNDQRIPTAIKVTIYSGDPLRSWEARRLVKGSVTETYTLDLEDI